MKKELLHTPEGVRDIYNGECEKKIVLCNKLCKTMELYGYHIMQTPTFEFFNIFGSDIGTTPSRDLFKFFDRDGNTLVLRPDITPSIARAVSKYFMDETLPVKIYYNGNTFINNHSYHGKLKEVTQIGAEFIGDNSVMADAELISVTVDALTAAGLKDFQISIGHAEFFKGLVEAVGIDDDTVQEIRTLLLNKNFFGVDELISLLNLSDEAKALCDLLGGFHPDVEEFKKVASNTLGNEMIKNALERLIELDEVLKIYGIDKYVSYELGNVVSYDYYTGVIFSAYTYGTGEPVVKGGRYNKLLGYFGKDKDATGLAIVVDQLMAALERQGIELDVKKECELVCFTDVCRSKAVAYASDKRKEGKNVELMPMQYGVNREIYEEYAKKNNRDVITFIDGE